MIYLDYAATTPVDGEVLDAMMPYLKDDFGNPDSTHAAGRSAARAVSEARAKVAEALGVNPLEVYFTSGGTEADNWAVRCLGTGRAAVSAVEHAAVLEGAKLREEGFDLIPVSAGGLITPEAVCSALKPDTGLVCVMAANNETGTVEPLKEISEICKERGIVLFSDCVQASLLDLRELTGLCGAVALSGHKIYAPKGTGALVVKKGVKLRPLIAGGEQERALRGGTLNVAGIVGFAVALERAQRERQRYAAHCKTLRDLFEDKVKAAFGDRVRMDGENRLPNISHLTFVSAPDALLAKLDLAGLCVSGGAACSSHSALPSHVMLAMGRSEKEAKHGVRFSFGKETTEEEILQAVKILTECIK
ncbi:MAG: cysteine desulfurase [Clostridia bacterium]|nr:cysteine desulfurase [Clostridia bacterium]